MQDELSKTSEQEMPSNYEEYFDLEAQQQQLMDERAENDRRLIVGVALIAIALTSAIWALVLWLF